MGPEHEVEGGPLPTNPCACDCAICVPERWVPAARGRLSSGLSLVGGYPSLLHPPHFSPTVLLLDTCVVQHLEWIRERAPVLNDDIGWRYVSRHYGPAMAQELQALFGLLRPVEAAYERPSIWVVGQSSWRELCKAPQHRRVLLLREWRFWRERATCFSEGRDIDPEIEAWSLFCSSPEENKWPGSDQDRLPGLETIGVPSRDEFGPFNDAGDRELIREALCLKVPGILTTDLKSFWRYRRWLFDRGVEVWRPSHLSWALLDEALIFGRGAEIIPEWPMRPIDEDFPDFPDVEAA